MNRPFNDPFLVEAAKAHLVPPGEFGERNFDGPDHIGETHMISISQNRDSNALDRSNFAVVSEDMLSRFPEDCEVMRFGHWACGWVESLIVRVLKTDYKPSMPVDWEFADAFEAIVEWSNALADYPIADEMHYSATEHDELIEFISNENYDSEVEQHGITIEYEAWNLPDDHAEQIASWLYENRSIATVDELDIDDIKLAARELSIAKPQLEPLIDDLKNALDKIDTIKTIVDDIGRDIATLDDLKISLALMED